MSWLIARHMHMHSLIPRLPVFFFIITFKRTVNRVNKEKLDVCNYFTIEKRESLATRLAHAHMHETYVHTLKPLSSISP